MPAAFTRETARMRMVISILIAGGPLLASCQETGWPTAAEVDVQCLAVSCSLFQGEQVFVGASAYDDAGEPLNGPWTWSSSNTHVATVLGSGTTATVAAVSVGQTTITAAYGGGGSGSVTVTVLPVKVASPES